MRDSVKPNLLIIGAMKASTTLLYNMLGRHPEIWFAAEKEPHYFTSPDYGKPEAYRSYLRLFESCPAGKKFVGEASTGYSKAPFLGATPQRIRETLGQPKLIYILRDPVQRTISNFRHAFARGYYRDGYPVSRAALEDPIIIGASLYARQLAEYESAFGAGSVHVLIADELHREPARVLGELERFLGVEPFPGWDVPVAKLNSETAVKQAVIAGRLGARTAFARRIKPLVPGWMKSALFAIAPQPPKATPVMPAEEDMLLDLVADDLLVLHGRLGDRINCWPSVRKLRARSAQSIAA